MLGTAGLLVQDRALEAATIYLRIALSVDPGMDVAALLLAEILERAERPAEALALYQGVDPASPWAGNARLSAALALDASGDADAAVATLRSIVEERPEDVDALITLADVLRRTERYDDSIGIYDRAIDAMGTPGPLDWSVFYARGIALERSRLWDRAERDFQRALELQPEQPLVLNYLAYSWAEQGRRLDEAQRMVERAVELRPDDGFIVDSLGWILYLRGRFDEAVPMLERAVDLSPGDPLLNDHLGDAYWQVGRLREARFQWRHALDRDPPADQAAQLRDKLEYGLEPTRTAAR